MDRAEQVAMEEIRRAWEKYCAAEKLEHEIQRLAGERTALFHEVVGSLGTARDLRHGGIDWIRQALNVPKENPCAKELHDWYERNYQTF